jgi:hypothetical protein
VRHRRSAKQRLWLGPGRYLCGCERRIANTDAYCDTDGHRNCNPHCNSNSNSYGNSYAYGHTNGDSSPVTASAPAPNTGASPDAVKLAGG